MPRMQLFIIYVLLLTLISCSGAKQGAHKSASDSGSEGGAPIIGDSGPQITNFPLSGPKGEKHYNILFILLKEQSFTQEALSPNGKVWEFYTPETLGELFFNSPTSVASYLKESSHQKVTVSGDMVGWIDINGTGVDGMDLLRNQTEYINQVSEYVDYSKYDILYFVGKTTGEVARQAYTMGFVNTPQGRFQMGRTFLVNTNVYSKTDFTRFDDIILPNAVWAHEMIHAIGPFGHSNSLDCGSVSISNSCTKKEYGNVFSVMGEYGFASHVEASTKLFLGWIDESQVITPQSSGQYTITAQNYDSSADKLIQIMLPTPQVIDGDTYDRIFVEYRKPRGFDNLLNRLDGSSVLDIFYPGGPIDKNGVIITLADARPIGQTALIDAHPTTSFRADKRIIVMGNAGKFADAMLLIGESINIFGVNINPQTSGASNITIQITLP